MISESHPSKKYTLLMNLKPSIFCTKCSAKAVSKNMVDCNRRGCNGKIIFKYSKVIVKDSWDGKSFGVDRYLGCWRTKENFPDHGLKELFKEQMKNSDIK